MKKFLTIIVLIFLCISISPAIATDKTFWWDANTESDLKGYKAYRASAPNVTAVPANLWLTIWKPGENPDPSNLQNVEYTVLPGGECQIIQNVLPDGAYYFVWTAFDIAGNESGISNEVSTIIDETAPAPPGGLQCSP